MFRGWYVISIGLIAVQSHPSQAKEEHIRHHLTRAVHHHNAFHVRSTGPNEDKSLSSLKVQVRDLHQKVGEIDSMREELAEFKAKLWGPLLMTSSVMLLQPQSTAVVEPKEVTLKLPDVSQPDRLPDPPHAPINPATVTLPAVIEGDRAPPGKPKSALEEAKTYLLDTSAPGYTMLLQGPDVAIGRLHPDFIVKLAEAIRRAREAGMPNAGVYSAYRPPAYGIGGFRDKFNSLHSYGLAADITGIGQAGSKWAQAWQSIVNEVGLYLPYGSNSRAEFNHTQLVPNKIASNSLRRTITADGPMKLSRMWLASGLSSYVDDIEPADSQMSAMASEMVLQALPSVAGANHGKHNALSVRKKDRAGQKTAERRRSPTRLASGPRARARRHNLAWMHRVLVSS